MVSGRERDKFKDAHLTPEKSKRVNAPIVKEFPYALECNLVRQVDLGLHTMFKGWREIPNAYFLEDRVKIRE
jgi:flavin reductase (DIM6/NTAB) family NADH-FMN oxidoreductase RutF